MKFKLTGLSIAAAAALGIVSPLVMDFEGLSLKKYKDPVGIDTACYGETHKLKEVYTREECEILLNQTLVKTLAYVEASTPTKLEPESLAAIASLTYNIGPYNYSQSTLLKKLNAGDIRGACNEISRWVYAGRKKLPGLERRRQAERQLCLKGVK